MISPYIRYPSPADDNFYEVITRKKQFEDQRVTRPYTTSSAPSSIKVHNPHQNFVHNFLNPYTPANGLLYYFGTGSGKTCASLLPVEAFKPYILAKGGKVIVLGKNANHVKSIFSREIYDPKTHLDEIDSELPLGSKHCLGTAYFPTKFVDGINAEHEKKFVFQDKKIKRYINDIFEFYGYGEFASIVQNIKDNKEFLEDRFSNCVIVIDEAHNLSGPDRDTHGINVSDNMGYSSNDIIIANAERLRLKIISNLKNRTLSLIRYRTIAIEPHIENDLHNEKANADRCTQLIKQATEDLIKLIKNKIEKATDRALQDLAKDIKEFFVKVYGNELPDDLEHLKTIHSGLVNDFDSFFPDEKTTEAATPATESTEVVQDSDRDDDDAKSSGSELSTKKAKPRKKTKRPKRAIEKGRAYNAVRDVVLAASNIKLLLLTATPMRDNPRTIIRLINLLRQNDDRSPYPIDKLFNGLVPQEDPFKDYLRGYVSYFRGNSPMAFPKIYWSPGMWPKDQPLIPNYEKIMALEDIVLEQYATDDDDDMKPKITIIKCQPDEEDTPQVEEYIRYAQLREGYEIDDSENQTPQSSRKTETTEKSTQEVPRIQYEYRCNFAFPLKSDKDESGYVIKYTKKDHFDKLFTISTNNKYDYTKLAREDLLAKTQLSKYSYKLHTMLNIITHKSCKGIQIVYSHWTDYGCYLIALALEKAGYRRHKDNHLWSDAEIKRCPKICSVCSQYDDAVDEDTKRKVHGPDGHEFRQARYIVNSGQTPSDDIDPLMNILTGSNNRYGEQIKVIVGTTTITEGLDLKFVRGVHVFEPWYNITRLDQLVGRGSRYLSHIKLPEVDQNVTVFLYCFVLPEKYTDTIQTRDQINYKTALEKDYNIKHVERLMQQSAIDCFAHKRQNIRTSLPERLTDFKDIENSRDCSYRACEYTCNYEPMVLTLKKNGKSGLSLSLNRKDFKPMKYDIAQTTTVGDLLMIVNRALSIQPTVGYAIGYYTKRAYSGDEKLSDILESEDELSDDLTVHHLMINHSYDYSTYNLFAENVYVQHLTTIIKVVISNIAKKDVMGNQNTVTFNEAMIMNYIDSQFKDFSIPYSPLSASSAYEDYKLNIVKYVLDKMSGFYVEPRFQLDHFTIIPLGEPPYAQPSVDDRKYTYYVLHPLNLTSEAKTTYYEHVLSSITVYIPKFISLNYWAKKSISTGTQITDVDDKNYKLFDEINKYVSVSEDWNKYRIYTIFSKMNDKTLCDIMNILINPVAVSKVRNYNIIVTYLAQFLRLKNIVTNYLDKEKDKERTVSFIYKDNNGKLWKYQLKFPNTVSPPEQYTGIFFSSYIAPSKQNDIALGFCDYKSINNDEIVFKWIDQVAQAEKKSKTSSKKYELRGQNCATTKKLTNDTGTGLRDVYIKLYNRALGITKRKKLPSTIIPNIPAIDSKTFAKQKEELCSLLEACLHFMQEIDDRLLYFNYQKPSSVNASEATPKKTPKRKAK